MSVNTRYVMQVLMRVDFETLRFADAKASFSTKVRAQAWLWCVRLG